MDDGADMESAPTWVAGIARLGYFKIDNIFSLPYYIIVRKIL
jgi:hypothetical protein